MLCEYDPMRMWTVQPRSVWVQIGEENAARVDPDNPKYEGRRPWQYEWLAAALERHHPAFDGGWPWWLSLVEPDLDQEGTKSLPGGIDQTCLELELPDERCAVFPLWMWETIYTGHYLAGTLEELDSWCSGLRAAVSDPNVSPLPSPWQGRLESSWERLFDEEWRPPLWYRDGEVSDREPNVARLMREASPNSVAVTQELRSTDIVRVTQFEGAAPGPNR